jgi:glycosyltransferase involved in cell wall biosynthesis
MMSPLRTSDPEEMPDPDVLFIGNGASAVAWYRCYMPATYMGADWIGVVGEPPDLSFVTGLVRGKTQLPKYGDYRVIVVQQPRGVGWRKLIKELRRRGITVIFEVDDLLHGIPRVQDHDYKHNFGPSALKDLELNMRACDGIICSTDFIAEKYRRFNANVWVCENALDLGRYKLTRPERGTVNIGWSGGTGHLRAVVPWFQAAAHVMRQREHTRFVAIGQPDYAEPFKPHFGDRALGVPFTPIEVYPAAMTLFDVALAPAGRGRFFRGKSDLRWLEAGALGIPTIADPLVYPKIEHGVTGFHAERPEEVEELLLRLVDDPNLRAEVGDNAKRYVADRRDMKIGHRAWVRALNEAVGVTPDLLAAL